MRQLDELVSRGDLGDAVRLARAIEDSSSDIALPLARLADALRQSGQLDAAAEFFRRSVSATERERLDPGHVLVIRLAAASVYLQAKDLSAAMDGIRPVFHRAAEVGQQQRQLAVTVCLKIGSAALSRGEAKIAREAYSLALEFGDDTSASTAALGEAWAVAISNEDPLLAAQKLAAFIDRYPEHDDVPRASRACAQCLTQAGRNHDASIMMADLLDRWPESDAAYEVVRSHTAQPIDQVPRSVRDWLMASAKSDDLQSLDANTTVMGIMVASGEGNPVAWQKLANHLSSIDQTGQATSDLLEWLDASGFGGDAERLAVQMIAPADEPTRETAVSSAALEAASRWAGRTERWSMLALAAESLLTGPPEQPVQNDPTRTIAVERLFAEALTQTGKTKQAGTLWNWLVDQRGADDFATLLRCAESETAMGTDVATATERIARARHAAGSDPFRLALVDLVDAEVAIRRLRFDAARSRLENVVRSSQITADLRGRAQWLIGETHYLQHEFARAIEAYRRVEGIDPGGAWISASLIQAGKSFEQLGRTREAAVCYGHLQSRFADTSHAAAARRRMAAITPQESSNNAKPSIRR